MGFILLAIVFAVGAYVIKTYNYFKKQHQEIEKQRSGIEVALTNRYDTLMKLNKTVNAFTQHESDVLMNVTRMRKGMSAEELSGVEGEISKAFSGIAALAENYPELKSDANFIQMQETIFDIENTLQATRRLYNNEVSEYNSKLETFPSGFVAKKMKIKAEPYFQADDHKRNDVDLSF